MITFQAAMITNHPELGIRAQPYRCGPSLTEVAFQFSLLQGREIKPRDMRWIIHGNLLFIYAEQAGYEPFHFNGCKGHELSLRGPTLVFFCPATKQDAVRQLSIAGSWAHIADNFAPEDTLTLQTLFSHGEGTFELGSTKNLLIVAGDPERASGARERAEPGAEKSGGLDLEQMFEAMTGAGFDVKLLEIGDEVVGLMAMGGPDVEPYIERELSDDPGFYADRPMRGHSVALTIVSEVNFDPLHYPSPSGFVMALIAGYSRALHLNIGKGYLEPEYGTAYLAEVHDYIKLVGKHWDAEPVYAVLESPLLAKMPDEKGGMGR